MVVEVKTEYIWAKDGIQSFLKRPVGFSGSPPALKSKVQSKSSTVIDDGARFQACEVLGTTSSGRNQAPL
jgi:hypothetical protein